MSGRAAARQRGVVLLYHRIIGATEDPLGLAVTPERFRDHLAMLADEADVVPLDRIFEPTPRGRSVAVTFDDGYADNVETAAPLLTAAAFPATVFVVASDPAQEFWWDRLDHLLDRPPADGERLDLVIGGQRLRADVRSDAAREQARRALNHRIRPLHPDAIEVVLDRVSAQMGRAPAPCAAHRRATVAELRTLAATPGLRVGSHTRHHAMLGPLPAPEQERELADSRHRLETELGRPVDTVAYPYGMDGSWTRRTERIARDAGYRLGCTNVVGVVRPHTPRHRVPRCQVWECSAGDLRVRLRGWLDGDR